MRLEIAVVIPTYQHATMLEALLHTLKDQTLPVAKWEVIVVDDCSTDATFATVERLSAEMPYRLRALRTSRNDGPAAARNLGWQSTEATVVAFLDDDCIPSPGWLEAGSKAFDIDDPPGVLQGPTLAPAGADLLRNLDWYICRHVVEATPYFEGGNLFFPRRVLEETGGFDEEIRWYGEDCAAGWRVLEAGYTQGFAEGAIVTHPMEWRGMRWFIHNGWIESRVVSCAAKHPGFRREAFWRPWACRKEDPALVAAVAGVIAGIFYWPAFLLVLPYLWWRRPTMRRRSFFRLCFQVPLVDAARVAGHLRGSLSNRIFVL
jgi:glycosyltransferase involved in cell wall biosynthesis